MVAAAAIVVTSCLKNYKSFGANPDGNVTTMGTDGYMYAGPPREDRVVPRWFTPFQRLKTKMPMCGFGFKLARGLQARSRVTQTMTNGHIGL